MVQSVETPTKPEKKTRRTRQRRTTTGTARKTPSKKTANKKTGPSKKTAAKKSSTKATKGPLSPAELKEQEAILRKKYPAIVVGSLRNIGTKKDKPHFNKRSVEITCAHRGCKETRRIATSDLAQVKQCEEHTRLARLKRKQEQRAKARKKRKK